MHTSNREYKFRHAHIGPGGMGCPCCTDFPPTKMKRVIHRKSRRTERQELRREAYSQEYV